MRSASPGSRQNDSSICRRRPDLREKHDRRKFTRRRPEGRKFKSKTADNLAPASAGNFGPVTIQSRPTLPDVPQMIATTFEQHTTTNNCKRQTLCFIRRFFFYYVAQVNSKPGVRPRIWTNKCRAGKARRGGPRYANPVPPRPPCVTCLVLPVCVCVCVRCLCVCVFYFVLKRRRD